MGSTRPAAMSGARPCSRRSPRGHVLGSQTLWVALGLLAGVVVAVAWIPLREGNSTVDVALALVVVITLMGVTARRWPVAAAALSSAVCFTFFDTAPYDRFAITRLPDVATAVMLVVVGLLTGELAVRVACQGRSDHTMSGNLGRYARRHHCWHTVRSWS